MRTRVYARMRAGMGAYELMCERDMSPTKASSFLPIELNSIGKKRERERERERMAIQFNEY